MTKQTVRALSSVLGVAAVLTACGDEPTAPADQLSPAGTSAHFAYYAAENDYEAIDTVYQERHYAWAMAKLELSHAGKIEYRKYRDGSHMERVTGRVTNGFAEPEMGRFHTIWPLDNHEYIHVVFVDQVGEPPALFNEGVAVAHHGASISGDFEGPPLWNGTSAHQQVRQMLSAGTLPELGALAETNDFRALDDVVTYGIAGSFVRFLIDEGGVDRFKAFAASTHRDDGRAAIDSAFEGEYGATLESWWARWMAFLAEPTALRGPSASGR